MAYRALGDHCYPTDIYREHMSGSAKSQQYCQRLKQAYSRKGGGIAPAAVELGKEALPTLSR
jgi:hypothetical protein